MPELQLGHNSLLSKGINVTYSSSESGPVSAQSSTFILNKGFSGYSKKKKSEPELQQLYNSRWVLELHKCHLFRKENGTEEQGPASRCEKINIWELTDLSWGSGFICLDVFSPLTDPVCMYLISSVWAAASLGLDVLNLHRRGYDMFAACFYKLAELPG